MNPKYILSLLFGFFTSLTIQGQLLASNYKNITPYNTGELDVIERIYNADVSCSWDNLETIVEYSSANFSNSINVATALTDWLNERHDIYSGKSPIEVRQFRGYLIYTLSKFKPTNDLFTYVTYELQTTTKIFNLAAAAHTAKVLETNIPNVINYLNKQLTRIVQDEWVDITTYKLEYPLKTPTKATYEIIKTLGAFGAKAQSSTVLLNQIIDNQNKRLVDKDTQLIQLAKEALQNIKEKKLPKCCRKTTSSVITTCNNDAVIVNKKQRNSIPIEKLNMIDQNGENINFKSLTGKPFVFTFFYTSCSNALKCASTVEKLGKLQKLIEKAGISNKVNVYGMTYDTNFDTPETLKRYGKMLGVKFSKNCKFLIPIEDSKNQFFKALDVKVNYGVGSVNHHGTQLFICDNQGGIAVEYQNTVWKTEDVFQKVKSLLKE